MDQSSWVETFWDQDILNKVLSEGERFYGGAFQFQRDSLIEIMENLRIDLMLVPVQTYQESEMEKRIKDTLLLVRDTPSDFVYLDADEIKMLGIDRHFKKMNDIRTMLKKRKEN